MTTEEKPEFFTLLGLAPPVTVDDVKQAYLTKVKQVHPDHGGHVEDFMRLEQAFQQALEYAEFRASRQKWLGAQVERYAVQESIVQEIQKLGGTVDYEPIDWMKRSFGVDFSQLMDRLVGLHLTGPKVTDAILELLAREHHTLNHVHSIELANSKVTDQGILLLRVFGELRHLDLSGTQATDKVLALPQWMPNLERLGVRNTKVSTFARLRTKWSHPRLSFV